jgi:hypothetical protein
MTVTTTSLTRAAGISAALAGALFIGVQIGHPPMTTASVETTDWLVRNIAKAVMAALALVGITGLYLRQVRQTGVLGLIGYLVFGAGYLLMFGVEVVASAVLPFLTTTMPGYVNDVMMAAFGETPASGIGGMQTVLNVAGLGFIAGSFLFGVALFRAGVVARWASALLAVAAIGTLSLAVLPSSFNRPMAVPTGIALIGLGVSLWRDQRTAATEPVAIAAVVETVAAR